jgi:hypothetical protein
MMMRYMGGGIGHKATNTFTQVFAREAQNFLTNRIDGEPQEDDARELSLREETGDSDGEEDYGYVIESESEEGDEEEEELGGEDGEEPWEMDDIQAERFDEL